MSASVWVVSWGGEEDNISNVGDFRWVFLILWIWSFTKRNSFNFFFEWNYLISFVVVQIGPVACTLIILSCHINSLYLFLRVTLEGIGAVKCYHLSFKLTAISLEPMWIFCCCVKNCSCMGANCTFLSFVVRLSNYARFWCFCKTTILSEVSFGHAQNFINGKQKLNNC